MTESTKSQKPLTRFARLLKEDKLTLILRNGRKYYAVFYVMTGLALIGLGLSFFSTATLVSASAYASWYGAGFLINGLIFLGLALTIGKELTVRSWRTRLKKFAVLFTAGLVLLRGTTAALLTQYGFWFAMINPLWAAFVILWVAPLLFYLPTEADEWVGLRDRVDDLQKRLDQAVKELEALKRDRRR